MVTLKEGDKAPAFSGTDQDGNKISLAYFKGKKIALYFYPRMIHLPVLYRLVTFGIIMD